jgi:MFS family permease
VPHNTRLLRLVIAYGGAAASEWATWLAVLVYAHDRGGTAATGWTALGLLLPAVVFAPIGARLLDSGHPVGTLCATLLLQTAGVLIAAVLTRIDAPILVVALAAGITIGGTAVVRMSFVVIAPAFVATARELTRSNLWAGWCDSGCVVVGPLAAAALLAWRGPNLVFLIVAAVSLGSSVAAISLLPHERPFTRTATVRRSTVAETIASLRGRPRIVSLLLVMLTQHVVMGFLDLMFVVLAVDVLHLGNSGSGLLITAFGVGALCSTVAASTFTGRAPLAPVVVTALGVGAAAMMTIGWRMSLVVAVVGLGVAGCSRSLVELCSRILLQRSAPAHQLASVFGAMEVLTSVGVAMGTGLAQWAVATVGPRRGLVLLGAALLAVLVVAAPFVWKADRDADVPVVAIALLRSMPIFAPLAPPVLEDLARAASERHVRANEVVIRQGEQGHRYFAIASGSMEVVTDGRHTATLRPGQGAGEVSLLVNIPRTATVTAHEPSTLYEIDRDAFLAAVTGNTDAHLAAWWHLQTLGHVRPGLAD